MPPRSRRATTPSALTRRSNSIDLNEGGTMASRAVLCRPAALCGFASLGTVVLGLLSMFHSWDRVFGNYQVGIIRGALYLHHYSTSSNPLPQLRFRCGDFWIETGRPLGLGASSNTTEVPCFATAAILALIPASAMLRAYARRVRAVGVGVQMRCKRCAYDLTGNVSGRCPECGASAR